MKICIVVLAVLAVTTFTTADVANPILDPVVEHEVPTQLEDVDADGGLRQAVDFSKVRQKRLTCDVFSFESGVVTPNNGPCALKCIAQGRKGGHCENSLCKCRDDKWTPW